jgi:hypothetical protein
VFEPFIVSLTSYHFQSAIDSVPAACFLRETIVPTECADAAESGGTPVATPKVRSVTLILEDSDSGGPCLEASAMFALEKRAAGAGAMEATPADGLPPHLWPHLYSDISSGGEPSKLEPSAVGEMACEVRVGGSRCVEYTEHGGLKWDLACSSCQVDMSVDWEVAWSCI